MRSDLGLAKTSETLFGLPHGWSVILKIVISFVLIPGVMTVIGAIIEHSMYGTTNNPHYHIVLLTYAGLIAAPFIIIHWTWKWPQHIYKMGFLFYALFSIGFFVALSKSTISGRDIFYTGKFIREIFSGKEESVYKAISTKQEAINWLEMVVNNVYDDSEKLKKNMFSSQLPGRIVLVQPMRMRQVRTVPDSSGSMVKEARVVNSHVCYWSFSGGRQDESSYSNMNFSYYNPHYVSYSDHKVFASDISISSMIDTYPLAGHWVMWPTQLTGLQAKRMMRALKDNNWVEDHQGHQSHQGSENGVPRDSEGTAAYRAGSGAAQDVSMPG